MHRTAELNLQKEQTRKAWKTTLREGLIKSKCTLLSAFYSATGFIFSIYSNPRVYLCTSWERVDHWATVCTATSSAPPSSGFLASYGGDFAMPFSVYFAVTSITHFDIPLRERIRTLAPLLFLGCSIEETAQRFGSSLFSRKGTFDWYDFLAYGGGLATAIILDKLTLNKRNPQNSLM